MNNFQPLINEVLNLDCGVFIEKLDNQIKRMASNPNVDIKHITDLIDIKYNYMTKFVQSMNKFKQLDSEQQMILYLYVLKNKSCYYLTDKLKVSVRTFFRKLNKINQRWFYGKQTKSNKNVNTR